MINLIDWLEKIPDHKFSPLFDADEALNVKTIIKSSKNGDACLLCRHPTMESDMIDVIEKGLVTENWVGIVYIMGVREFPNFVPLYIGKAERKGVKNSISVNIKNIRGNKSKFARWGDGLDYHVGDLSHAMFGFEAYRKSTKKYTKWAETLFVHKNKPTLKEKVYFYIAPWYENSRGLSSLISSLPAVEKEIIAIASVQFKNQLLNVDGI